jgi:hypothetical protein
MTSETKGTSVVLKGGCQCGDIRYTSRTSSHDTYYCHCRMCQRAFGNVFAAFFNVRKDGVTWDKGALTYFASTKFARRGFCGRCGTPLAFEYLESAHMDLSVGSLDEPGSMRPTSHFGIESRLPSFYTEDGLPGKRIEDVGHIMKKWEAAYGKDVKPGPR